MLTLPSGQIVTLSAVPLDPPSDAGKARLRRHLLASATEVQDLFPLLEVVRFGQHTPQVASAAIGRLFAVPALSSGLVPQATGLSLLDFDDTLDSADKMVFESWVSGRDVCNWIDAQLRDVIRHAAAQGSLRFIAAAKRTTSECRGYRLLTLRSGAAACFRRT